MLQKLTLLGPGWRFPCPLCRWWPFLFETGSQEAQVALKFTMLLRITLNSQPFCLQV